MFRHLALVLFGLLVKTIAVFINEFVFAAPSAPRHSICHHCSKLLHSLVHTENSFFVWTRQHWQFLLVLKNIRLCLQQSQEMA